MFGNKTTTAQKTIGTLIGAGTVVEGTVTYSGGLRIDGTVKGDVRGTSGDACMVVISEHGKVEGEVHAAHLVVSGAVNGPLHVSQLLELQPKARITGDVHYHGLEIHHGAVVEGRLIYSAAAGEGRPPLKLAAGGTTSDN
ncbi:MAG TPA: polymer-forming cytoskeletal protein [Gemmatimonadaceae bacterium]|nr:polymer-forming cytoskeletal protein [Gemmatimonadaceae bacterium]